MVCLNKYRFSLVFNKTLYKLSLIKFIKWTTLSKNVCVSLFMAVFIMTTSYLVVGIFICRRQQQRVYSRWYIYTYILVWRKQCQDLSWTEKSTPKQFYWLKLAFELGFYNWPLAVNVLLLVLSNTIECFGSTHPRSQLGAVNPRKKQKKIRRSLQVVMLAIRICQREGAKWKSPRRKEKKIIC